MKIKVLSPAPAVRPPSRLINREMRQREIIFQAQTWEALQGLGQTDPWEPACADRNIS